MISIIVPVHNSELFITPCVNSILSQNGVSSYELLLVDDGSADASLSICKAYEKKFDNVHVLSKNNGGVSSARNMGIEAASGDLICFVDSDDALLPNALSRMANEMEDTSIDLFIGGYIVKKENEKVLYSLPEIDAEILSREQGIEQMYHPHPYRYQGYIWNKMFRRSVIEQSHLRFDETISYNEDRLFVTQYIAAQRGRILLDNVPVYSYYEREGGAMGALNLTFNPKYISDFVALIRMKQAIRKSFHSKTLIEMANEGIYISYVRIHQMMGRPGQFDRQSHTHLKRLLFASVPLPFLVKKKIQSFDERFK